ncbi:hypothetical protein LEM8419_01786 [Neolewinella maritima]|uniref:FAS1 domain-containing protein n=1 Tax=Neolewinella maritima TaxID=1383882 RepID=A0ABN8F2M5_9BACT|nr:fasciclin domain-containing protein [Neolewinella maritima]CAH1000652.1 hypothetical protein LEM8419_01786 [Neolewinella maritima]
MTKHFNLLTLFLCVMVLGFSACDDDEDQTNNPVIGSITDIVQGSADFTTLAAALQRTGLDSRLDQATGRFTVFAPTDAAFQAAGVDLAALSDAELTNILAYHVLSGTVIRDGDIASGRSTQSSFNTSNPGGAALPLTFDNDGSTIRINDMANVTGDRIQAVNGSIYAIDMLLMPPSIVDGAVLDGRFTTLITALERTGLDDVLSDTGAYTVFAPTDAAFTALGRDLDLITEEELREILLYHVIGANILAADIPGGMSFQTTLNTEGPDESPLSLLINSAGDSVMINQSSNVVATDVIATNGVIHAVDMVLMPQSVVDFVVKTSMLDSLQAALTAAGQVDDLDGDGPYTVFAPVNAAFTAAADTVATLDMDQLREVLLNHVIVGANNRSEDVEEGSITTASMEDIDVVINQDADGNDLPPVLITSDSTQVNFTTFDIQGTNGVIHLIDGVLLPDLDN